MAEGNQIPQPDIGPDDYIIALMGMTGVGKSSFIQLFTNETVPIGLDLESCTESCAIYPCRIAGDTRTFWLADTPGFDDSRRSDFMILRELSSWLAKSYSDNVKLTGIIYLHRIADVRLGGAAMKNLRMFNKLVGEGNLGSIVLATTFWETVDRVTAELREVQLQSTDEFWSAMMAQGSRVFRHDQGLASGTTILQHLINRNARTVFGIQRELVDQGLRLDQTAAGTEVQEQVEKLRVRYEAELATLRQEMSEAIAAKDEEAKQEIAGLLAKQQEWMQQHKEEMKKAKARSEELWETRVKERQNQRDRQFKELQRYIDLQKTMQDNALAANNREWELKMKLYQQKAYSARLRASYNERCSVM